MAKTLRSFGHSECDRVILGALELKWENKRVCSMSEKCFVQAIENSKTRGQRGDLDKSVYYQLSHLNLHYHISVIMRQNFSF